MQPTHYTALYTPPLTTFLHADYLRSRMPKTVRKFKASPVSGFFLFHSDDVTPPVPLYPNEMEHVFKMQKPELQRWCQRGLRCLAAGG